MRSQREQHHPRVRRAPKEEQLASWLEGGGERERAPPVDFDQRRDVRTHPRTDERRSRNPEWPPRPLSRLLTDRQESARERKTRRSERNGNRKR